MAEPSDVRHLVPLLPAIAAAIHDATGVWLTEQPFTPERVLAALERAAGNRSPVAVEQGRQGVPARSSLESNATP